MELVDAPPLSFYSVLMTFLCLRPFTQCRNLTLNVEVSLQRGCSTFTMALFLLSGIKPIYFFILGITLI